MPRKIIGAKIACLDFPLQKTKMHLGVSVVVSDPEKLEQIRREEIEITKRRVEKIVRSGANVVCLCLIYRIKLERFSNFRFSLRAELMVLPILVTCFKIMNLCI